MKKEYADFLMRQGENHLLKQTCPYLRSDCASTCKFTSIPKQYIADIDGKDIKIILRPKDSSSRSHYPPCEVTPPYQCECAI